MSAVASLLLALSLARPEASTAVSSRDKARDYFDQGLDAFHKERWPVALKDFEMAAMMGRFAFSEEALRGDSLHYATVAAVRAGLGKPALEHAREHLEWAQARGSAKHLARARNDLVEAYLVNGSRDEAETALHQAEASIRAAHDHDETERLKGLQQRLGGGGDDEDRTPRRRPVLPGGTAPDRARSEGPAVIVREVEAIDLTGESPAGTEAGEAAAPSPEPQAGVAALPSPPAAEEPMVLVPAGEFVMGNDQGRPDERPAHTVSLPPFYIDRHEVTNEAYAAFVAATGYASQGNWKDYAGDGLERHPVRGVTFADAEAYARWAGKRLPSEPEWERAARGPDGSRYAFGDEFVADKARVGLTPAAGPTPVERYPASPFGLHDLTGNVLEWCADWYSPLGYDDRPASEASARDGRRYLRVLRGGAWDADAGSALNSRRTALPPERAVPFAGFRCARDAEARRAADSP